MARIVLPWPSSKLSGHNTGHWSSKSDETAALRMIARSETRRAGFKIADEGDLRLRFDFYPPDNRSDRTNYYNRCKPIIDGIADGLKVNDKRFVPVMDETSFHAPEGDGRVEVCFG